jgi:hypothetical protein
MTADPNGLGASLRQKYRRNHPLPAPRIEETFPLTGDTELTVGRLNGGPRKTDQRPLGGIVEVEISPRPDLDGVIVANSLFTVRARVDVPTRDANVDLMLEIFRGEFPLYQSFLPEPLPIKAPRELWFEIPINSSLLPDDVYRIRLSLLLEPAGDSGRFVSRADIFVATKDCGTEPHPRARLFTDGPPPDFPLKTLDVEWRLVHSKTPDTLAPSTFVLDSSA